MAKDFLFFKFLQKHPWQDFMSDRLNSINPQTTRNYKKTQCTVTFDLDLRWEESVKEDASLASLPCFHGKHDFQAQQIFYPDNIHQCQGQKVVRQLAIYGYSKYPIVLAPIFSSSRDPLHNGLKHASEWGKNNFSIHFLSNWKWRM